MKWKCPKHKIQLRTVEDYPGALVCPVGAGICPDIFSVIDDHLCIPNGNQWSDVKTGETQVPPSSKEEGEE